MNRRINNAVRFVNRQSRSTAHTVGKAFRGIAPKPKTPFKDGFIFGLGFVAASTLVAIGFYGVFGFVLMRLVG